MAPWRTTFAITAWASIRATLPACSGPSRGCIPVTSRAPASAWRPCAASFTGMAGECGPRGEWIREPPSISRSAWTTSVPEPEVAPEPSPDTRARARRLLVVEDSDRDYALLTRELDKAGLNVHL